MRHYTMPQVGCQSHGPARPARARKSPRLYENVRVFYKENHKMLSRNGKRELFVLHGVAFFVKLRTITHTQDEKKGIAMPTIDEMSIEEVESVMQKLRERKRVLKKSGKTAERKIQTLARRRERFMDRIREIDAQIEALRAEAALTPAPAPKRRGRRPKNAVIGA